MKHFFMIFFCYLILNITSTNSVARQISFAGKTWQVRDSAGGPGNGCWSDSSSSVWVDGSGRLHLKIRQVNGQWCQAEIHSLGTAKYGEHRFHIDTRLDLLDPDAVVGLFAYKDDSTEIDIEFTSSFDASDERGFFVVQPRTGASSSCQSNSEFCRFPVNLSGSFTSHEFNWIPNGTILFESWHGHCANPPCGGSMQQWVYSGPNTPAQDEGLRIHINFWVNGPISSEQELVITDYVGNIDASPDLQISTLSVDDVSPEENEEFNISVEVLNNGVGDAASTTLRYYRSNNPIISTSDTQIETDFVSSLSPGEVSQEIENVSIAHEGTYYVGACVDPVSNESDTNNNCSQGVEVNVQLPSFPDLVISSIEVSDFTPVAGETFSISADVQNQGNQSSSSTTLRYYSSTDSTITTSDTQLSTDGVSSLLPGEISNESDAVTIPVPGAVYVGACVDGVSGEPNVNNNCSGGILVVVSAPFDCSYEITLPDGGELFYQGEDVVIDWINSGQDCSNTVRLELYENQIFDSLISSDAQNSGTYIWTIPPQQFVGANYKARIIDNIDTSVYDESDNEFIIETELIFENGFE